MSKSVLIIGSGGREHALAWKLNQSPKVSEIFIAPGNAGSSAIGKNVDIKATDILALAKFAEENKIDLTVVGPDDSLALGIVDEFQKRNLKIWGPSKAAARIESSKAFAKELMKNNGIPTAEYQTFTDFEKASLYIEQKGAPIVIKASGLALGKGVAVCKTLDEAKKFLADVMQNKIFGEAGQEVIVEEFLNGQEFSVHVFSDGENFKILPIAQDHKNIFEGDKGPNTGGMGTIAPVPFITGPIMDDIAMEIVRPTLKALKKLCGGFVGLLYPGLILTPQGVKVIEFNARFGDPETQSLMRLLKTDLFEILDYSVDGKLAEIDIIWSNQSACCIVLASGGYPGAYEKGKTITGIEEAEKLNDIVIFHAGTIRPPPLSEGSTKLYAKSNQRGGQGELLTNGGRVLGITAVGDNLQSALNKAYDAVKLINFEGVQYRTDIGAKTLDCQLPTTH